PCQNNLCSSGYFATAPYVGTPANQPVYFVATTYGKAGEAIRLAVPVHGNSPLKLGLFKGLLKDSGLSWP
ncbi:MAG: hypothetical protein KGN80_04320, partial [Acidobacteriota bacterium]|nr:hypothetical protein [Acidobacteriota bacterium]